MTFNFMQSQGPQHIIASLSQFTVLECAQPQSVDHGDVYLLRTQDMHSFCSSAPSVWTKRKWHYQISIQAELYNMAFWACILIAGTSENFTEEILATFWSISFW